MADSGSICLGFDIAFVFLKKELLKLEDKDESLFVPSILYSS
jgi:hypothetical protein